jgi:hypothetical protein
MASKMAWAEGREDFFFLLLPDGDEGRRRGERREKTGK